MAYKVELSRDESGAWIATVPGVRGCHTYGRSLRQVKHRIREALSLWVHDADRADLTFDVRLPAGARRGLTQAERARARALQAQQSAQREIASTASQLTNGLGLSVRDAADLLGLSHQRVQQILASQGSATAGHRE